MKIVTELELREKILVSGEKSPEEIQILKGLVIDTDNNKGRGFVINIKKDISLKEFVVALRDLAAILEKEL